VSWRSRPAIRDGRQRAAGWRRPPPGRESSEVAEARRPSSRIWMSSCGARTPRPGRRPEPVLVGLGGATPVPRGAQGEVSRTVADRVPPFREAQETGRRRPRPPDLDRWRDAVVEQTTSEHDQLPEHRHTLAERAPVRCCGPGRRCGSPGSVHDGSHSHVGDRTVRDMEDDDEWTQEPADGCPGPLVVTWARCRCCDGHGSSGRGDDAARRRLRVLVRAGVCCTR